MCVALPYVLEPGREPSHDCCECPSSIHPFLNPLIHALAHVSTYVSIHPPTPSWVHTFSPSSIHPLSPSSIHSLAHLSIHTLLLCPPNPFPSLSTHPFTHRPLILQVDMYAGAIFIQQSLHLDLYLAIVGLLAITALYTVAGIMGHGRCSESWWTGLWATQFILTHLLVFQCAEAIYSLNLYSEQEDF